MSLSFSSLAFWRPSYYFFSRSLKSSEMRPDQFGLKPKRAMPLSSLHKAVPMNMVDSAVSPPLSFFKASRPKGLRRCSREKGRAESRERERVSNFMNEYHSILTFRPSKTSPHSAANHLRLPASEKQIKKKNQNHLSD